MKKWLAFKNVARAIGSIWGMKSDAGAFDSKGQTCSNIGSVMDFTQVMSALKFPLFLFLFESQWSALCFNSLF